MSKVTILIPTINNEKDIEICLKALSEQTWKDFEILLVDGYSKDKTVEIGKRYGAKIVYDDGHTRGHACNTGLKYVTTPYVVFTDADCIPRLNWLEELMKQFELHPDTASIGGPNYSPPDDPDFAKCVDIVYSSKIMTGNARYGVIFEDVVELAHNPGCNAAYRMNAIKDIHFDPELPTAEDVAFDYKIKKNGGKILFTPYAIVWHRRRETLKGFWKQVYRYGLGRAITNKKYPELKYWYHIGPTLAIFALIALISLAITASFILRNLFPLFSIIILLILYLFMCLYGAAASYSRFKSRKYVIRAALLIPVGHLAWGIGYLKGVYRSRKSGNK